MQDNRDHQQRAQDLDALAVLLHSSDSVLRQALTDLFFPQFSGTAQRTLEALLHRHPYAQGYDRRAFRAPGHRLHAERAANWLWTTWQVTRDYPQDLAWFTVHAGLLPSWRAQGLGLLFAQALDDHDDTVFSILRDTAGTQHPVARMGRHVPQALLASARPEAWTLAEGLLLAAQRQEGLRQVIFETVDEAHPQAFLRFLHLILREDLLRFAACLRAVDVWFGLAYDVTDVKLVRGLLGQALGYLEDPSGARSAVQNGSGHDTYLALFTLAMHDAVEAARLARTLLSDRDPARRMAAAQVLNATQQLEPDDLPRLLADPDVRLGALAATRVNRWHAQPDTGGLTFEALVGYAARLGVNATHDSLLFPWLGQVPARADILDTLPALLGDRPFTAFAPHLSGMSSGGKTSALQLLKARQAQHALDAPTRDLLMTLLQDRNPSVAEEAVKVAADLTLAPEETEVVLVLLKRRSADLRRGLIRLLARDAQGASVNAAHLLATRNTEQRQAGLQLLLETGGPCRNISSPATRPRRSCMPG
ncbi:hypothetical protein ACFSC4_15955 [Deinococcus malanensis]|uniref:DUF5724 domain-containing protein n=1 Tax=Deinococcus malanensis TaxID=1706855 RepID=UPI00362B413A